jgi:hypothetical protein
MSTISDKTDEMFMAATLSDDDLGYPNGVEFVPGDEDWADEAVWRKLADGHPTLLVDAESELLLVPMQRSLLDRIRGRVAVNFGQCVNGRAPTHMTISHVGRHPLREIRELSLV